jgi:hypothetical protein
VTAAFDATFAVFALLMVGLGVAALRWALRRDRAVRAQRAQGRQGRQGAQGGQGAQHPPAAPRRPSASGAPGAAAPKPKRRPKGRALPGGGRR